MNCKCIRRLAGLFLLVLLVTAASVASAQDAPPITTGNADIDLLSGLIQAGGAPGVILLLGVWVLRSVERWLDKVKGITTSLVEGLNGITISVELEVPETLTDAVIDLHRSRAGATTAHPPAG